MSTLLVTLLMVKTAVAVERELSLRQTWKAICWTESRGDPRAIGDGGQALGIGQLHKVYVDEANRIIGRRKWSYGDRLDPLKSWQMFKVVSLYHHPHGTPEIWARCHVAGPDGHRRACSIPYWKKVRAAL